MARRAHVVIVGAGFGGLACVQALARADLDVTLVDRRNHHLFQPLLYQVTMAGLAPAKIAVPIRSILRRQHNARVLLADVTQVDLGARRVRLNALPEEPLSYDYLVLAPGACAHYFGNEHWSHFAPALKTLEDAVEIRRRVLLAFEAAEREPEPSKRAQLLSFLVVGGGPTGVELACAIAELARATLRRDFRRARASDVRVLLIEGRPRVLSGLAPELSDHAVVQLGALGVHVRTCTTVERVEPWGVCLRSGERLRAHTVLWAAGVAGAPLLRALSPAVEFDRQGRALVREDCSLPGFGEAFVIGDAACIFGALGDALPAVSSVAMQMGSYVGRTIAAEVADPRPSARAAFSYVDRGSMVMLGRGRAVAQRARKRLSGRAAWWRWPRIHHPDLVGFQKPLRMLLDWAWSYLAYRRGARVITGLRLAPSSSETPAGAFPLEESPARAAP